MEVTYEDVLSNLSEKLTAANVQLAIAEASVKALSETNRELTERVTELESKETTK
jgi:cell division protein FtsB